MVSQHTGVLHLTELSDLTAQTKPLWRSRPAVFCVLRNPGTPKTWFFRDSVNVNSKCLCKYISKYFKTWNKSERFSALHTPARQVRDDGRNAVSPASLIVRSARPSFCCRIHLTEEPARVYVVERRSPCLHTLLFWVWIRGCRTAWTQHRSKCPVRAEPRRLVSRFCLDQRALLVIHTCLYNKSVE